MATNRQSQRSISIAAPAKINLYFDILNKRDDGYHNILTLFQSIDLQDILTFEFQTAQNEIANHIEIYVANQNNAIDISLFPCDHNNLIAKAIEAFLNALDKKTTINTKVRIEKNIPIGAGLAGGSTDAAATLLALNIYFNNPFKIEKLCELAAQLGSDTSFCVTGGLATGRGRGEELERLEEPSQYDFVLVKPRHLKVSTPWAYKLYDQSISHQENSSVSHNFSNLLLALKYENEIEKHCQYFWNAFEEPIFKEFPILADLKAKLMKSGCISAHLTGSGPTIFGLVHNEEEGKKVLDKIRDLVKSRANENLQVDIWLVKSLPKGVHVLSQNHAGCTL